MEHLKVSILQTELIWEDPEANRQRFTQKLAVLPQTQLIVLPEMFTTGFSMNAEKLAEPKEGPTLKWMQGQAQKLNAAITGSLIVEDAGAYFNRLYFVFPDGTYQTYDKRHTFTLAGEHKVYTRGTQKCIIEYEGFRICPQVCYDLRFPVWARNVEDYDVLLYVANWPEKRTQAWDTLLKARAIENMAYCIGVNRIGSDGNGHPYVGHSAVYDVLGNRISQEDWESEFSQTLLLSKAHIQEVREQLQFLNDRDSFTLM